MDDGKEINYHVQDQANKIIAGWFPPHNNSHQQKTRAKNYNLYNHVSLNRLQQLSPLGGRYWSQVK